MLTSEGAIKKSGEELPKEEKTEENNI